MNPINNDHWVLEPLVLPSSHYHLGSLSVGYLA